MLITDEGFLLGGDQPGGAMGFPLATNEVLTAKIATSNVAQIPDLTPTVERMEPMRNKPCRIGDPRSSVRLAAYL